MKVYNKNSIKAIHLERSVSYENYLHSLRDILKANKIGTTDPGHHCIQDTRLNFHRMKRTFRTLVVDEELKDLLLNIDKRLLWMVIFDGKYGDNTQIIPALAKIAQQSEKIEMRVLLKNEYPDLTKQLFQEDDRIPKLICIDPDQFTELGIWEPDTPKALFSDKSEQESIQKEINSLLKKWLHK